MEPFGTNTSGSTLHSAANETTTMIQDIQTPISVVIQLSAMTGNLLVLVLFVKFKSLRSTGNLFSLNLAISDFLTGLGIYFVLNVMLWNRYKPFDFWGCGFIVCYPVVTGLVSALSVLCSTLDRLIAVKWALQYRLWVTGSKVILVILGIWLVSLIVGLAPLYDNSKDKWTPNLGAIVSFCGERIQIPLLFYNLIYLCFFIPLDITVFTVYWYICRIANKYTKARQARMNHALSPQDKKLITVSKSMKVFLVIFTIIVVCWLPQCILSFLGLVVDLVYLAIIVAVNLSVLSPAINPWIFTLRNTEFKSAFNQLRHQLCPRKVCSQQSHTENSNHPNINLASHHI